MDFGNGGGHALPCVPEGTEDEEVDWLGSQGRPDDGARLSGSQEKCKKVVVRAEAVPHVAEADSERLAWQGLRNKRSQRRNPILFYTAQSRPPRRLPPRRQTAELFQNPPTNIHKPIHTSGHAPERRHFLKRKPPGMDIIVRIIPTKG